MKQDLSRRPTMPALPALVATAGECVHFLEFFAANIRDRCHRRSLWRSYCILRECPRGLNGST